MKIIIYSIAGAIFMITGLIGKHNNPGPSGSGNPYLTGDIQVQDLTKPKCYVESLDRHVTPQSLYLTQLNERLGEEAVKNIIR